MWGELARAARRRLPRASSLGARSRPQGKHWRSGVCPGRGAYSTPQLRKLQKPLGGSARRRSLVQPSARLCTALRRHTRETTGPRDSWGGVLLPLQATPHYDHAHHKPRPSRPRPLQATPPSRPRPLHGHAREATPRPPPPQLTGPRAARYLLGRRRSAAPLPSGALGAPLRCGAIGPGRGGAGPTAGAAPSPARAPREGARGRRGRGRRATRSAVDPGAGGQARAIGGRAPRWAGRSADLVAHLAALLGGGLRCVPGAAPPQVLGPAGARDSPVRPPAG